MNNFLRSVENTSDNTQSFSNAKRRRRSRKVCPKKERKKMIIIIILICYTVFTWNSLIQFSIKKKKIHVLNSNLLFLHLPLFTSHIYILLFIAIGYKTKYWKLFNFKLLFKLSFKNTCIYAFISSIMLNEEKELVMPKQF